MTVPSISTFGQAIANAEGFGQPNAIPTIANNPGDLNLGDVGNGTINGITIFSSAEDGWSALENQLSKMFSGTSNVYNPNMTIDQVGQIWSNGDPNWSANVSNSLGTPSSTPLSALGNGTSPSPSTANTLSNGLGQVLSSMGPIGSIASSMLPGSGASSLSIARVLVIIVGILLIGAGLFAFKQTQTIIQTGTNLAKRGAELSAGG